MKFLIAAVSLMIVFAPQTVHAETVSATETVGDVTYTYEYDSVSAASGASIISVAIADSVTVPFELVIPAQLGGRDVVTMQGLDHPMISKVSFAGEVPEIRGNLYSTWSKTVSEALGLMSKAFETSPVTVPDTAGVLAAIPGFITNNYNHDSNGDGVNDTYYAGENLVRVDTAYSGPLTVKDGTVSILAGAMEGCADLGAVTLPDSVEWIGVRAFANSGVTSVNIPKGLMVQGADQIQWLTFYGCEKLTAVTFPEGTDTLGNIGYMAFYGCKSLNGFDFTRVGNLISLSFAKAFAPGAVIDVSKTQIGGAAAVFNGSGVGKVIFGAGNTYIPFEFLRNSTSLQEIVWSEENQTVSSWAFSDCTGLTYDVLENCNIIYMDHRSFANTGMTEVTIPESVTGLAGGVFAGNEQLETVNWKASGLQNFGMFFSLMNDCTGRQYHTNGWDGAPAISDMTEYTLPVTLNLYCDVASTYYFSCQPYLETVNFMYEADSVAHQMFMFCPSLETVTFAYPEAVTDIEVNAFMGCFSLKSFPFDQLTGLRTIGSNAFMLNGNVGGIITAEKYQALSDEEKGYGLTEIDLSGCTALSAIGNAAFFNQYNVTRVHVPASVQSITNAAFHGTVSMKEAIMDNDVRDDVFAVNFITTYNGYNSNLETVTLNGEITAAAGVTMFNKMTALKNVNLTEATAIPERAFLDCTALENVYAPKVTSVGRLAFRNTGLKKAAVSAGVTYGDYVFQNCAALETVVVEEGVEELSDFMFEGTTALENVSLPSTMKKVNWGAFKNSKGCTVEIPASVTVIEDDAFAGAAFELIFRGAPVVELMKEGFPEDSANIAPIDKRSVIYYLNSTGKTAAEVYAASVATEDAPAIERAEADGIALVISGAPDKVFAGSDPDLGSFKVMYAGTELKPDQYQIDYDAADKTLGKRTVTVTLTDLSIVGDGLKDSEVSAVKLSGEEVSGNVYTIGGTKERSAGFEVDVYTHKMTHVAAKAPSCEEDGNKEYYICETCGKVFRDEAGEIETAKAAEILPKKGHDYSGRPEFVWTADNSSADGGYSCKAIFTCSANGCISTMEKECRVTAARTDGKTKITVVYTAEADGYTDSRTVEINGLRIDSPVTGDSADVALWMVLMCVSASVILYLNKKRKYS